MAKWVWGIKNVISYKSEYYQNKYKVIDRICYDDKKFGPEVIFLKIVTYPVTIIGIFHELIHFVALWLFSNGQAQISFKPLDAYVILKPNANIRKNEGLISYLLPVMVITVIPLSFVIILLVLKFSFVLSLILLTISVINCGLSFYDFRDSTRLIKCKGKDIRLAHEKSKNGFCTIYYCS